MASLDHDYYCQVWKSVKQGEMENLDGKRKILAKLMLEHDQYQYFWEIPHTFAEVELEKAFEMGRTNPDLHIAIETNIAEQVENKNPPEIRQAYDALLAVGTDPHEARHVIGRVWAEMIRDGQRMSEKGLQPDEDFYLRRIRYLAKHPKKVIKDQERTQRKGL